MSMRLEVKALFGFLLIAAAYLLMIDPAFAQTATGAVSFRCSGPTAIGTLYDSSLPCSTTLKMSNVFSFLVCNVERLASNLLGQMYCGIMTDLIPAVMAMLTLATLFFGIGFTIGVIPATGRDFQLFLLKVAMISIFATQSQYLIGTGYAILVTGLREGVAVGLSTMFNAAGSPTPPTNGIEVYHYLDNFLAQAMHFATDYVGADWSNENTNPCKNALFAVLAIMAVAFPPIFFIAIMMIFRICITFLRAVFGYLYSIIGIVFLLTLSPLFLSFYLFRQTRPFFDKWIGYLVSFALQMVILFAFLGFILSIDITHVTSSLPQIVVPNREVIETQTARMPWQYCTLCDFKVVDKNNPAQEITDNGDGTFLEKGMLVCKDNPAKPIGVMSAMAPDVKDQGITVGAEDKKRVQNALLKFASVGLLSLFILAYMVEYALAFVPALSAMLAGGLGGSYAPQLGGGKAIGQKISMDMPGGTAIDTFEQGFIDGYSANQQYTGIGASVMGVKTGMERMVLGGRGANDPAGGEGASDPGLVRSTINFFLNPQNDDYGRH